MNGKHPDLSFSPSNIHGDVHRTVVINNKKLLTPNHSLTSYQNQYSSVQNRNRCWGERPFFSLVKTIITYPGVWDGVSLTYGVFIRVAWWSGKCCPSRHLCFLKLCIDARARADARSWPGEQHGSWIKVRDTEERFDALSQRDPGLNPSPTVP